jgi:hypothetical protein
MPTMVKVRPDSGPIKEMDIEELDALYTKPIHDKIQSKIDELCAAIQIRVGTGIEFHNWNEVRDRVWGCWDSEDNDQDRPMDDGTWKAWNRNFHKAQRVKKPLAEWAERAAKAESRVA